MKQGQEPAFPFFEHNESGYGNTVVIEDVTTGRKLFLPFKNGMSKRLLIAKDAMCSLLTNNLNGLTTEQLVGVSYECADELLKQEEL